MPGPHPPRAPSRASSSASLGGGPSTNAQLEALIGASRAFARPPPPSKAHIVPTNGALAAATSVGSKTPSPRNINATTRSSPSAGAPRDGVSPPLDGPHPYETPALEHSKIHSLNAMDRTWQSRHDAQPTSPSPADISPAFASMPARPRARTTHTPAVAPKPRQMSGDHAKAMDSSSDRPTDSSPIAPTTSLVDLFERKSSGVNETGKRPGPIVIKPSHDLPVRSPKPVRTSDGGITQLFKMQLDDERTTPKPAQDVEAVDFAPKPQMDGQSQSSDDAFTSAPENQSRIRSPIAVHKRTARTGSPSSINSKTSPTSIAERTRPPPSPLRLSHTGPIDFPPSRTTASPSSQFLAVSAHSEKSISAQYHQMHPRRVTPLNTGDDLANAIVASSLASSRAPSPRKVEPPPHSVPSRRQKYQNKLSFSRTPSPAKQGMLHTLRKIESSESEEGEESHPYGKHKKKRLVRKHPNKHHEGDRKRWRDAVTERERKRYEGVWAANKGLHISFTSQEEAEFRHAPDAEATLARKVAIHECVSSVVTREVWARSRLPDAVLETVWDLVDNDCIGRLSKVEFVVGLWLIDQLLKGRKLPVKVSDSVWASVKTLQGIKIKK